MLGCKEENFIQNSEELLLNQTLDRTQAQWNNVILQLGKICTIAPLAADYQLLISYKGVTPLTWSLCHSPDQLKVLETAIHHVIPLTKDLHLKQNLMSFLILNNEHRRLSFTYLRHFNYSTETLIGTYYVLQWF